MLRTSVATETMYKSRWIMSLEMDQNEMVKVQNNKKQRKRAGNVGTGHGCERTSA